MKLYHQKIGKGPVIVILHGLFGMPDNWMSIAKKLAPSFTLYLMDQRNHGKSPHDAEHNYDVMTTDLLEFFTEHNLKDVILIGHSMGGKAAMNFASKHSHLLSKLVIVDIAPKEYDTSYFADYLNAMCEMDLPDITSRNEAINQLQKKLDLHPATAQFLLKNLYRDDSNNFKWRINLDALGKNLESILGDGAVTKPAEIKTLFMAGEHSNYIEPQDVDIIKNFFPNSEIVEISGANHWVHASAPVHFENALLKFIEK